MKKNRVSNIIFFLFISVSMLLVAARPLPAKGDLVRLTIDNRTNNLVTLRLEGPNFYYLLVNSSTLRVFTPKRGEYSYSLYSCGLFVRGTLDLTKQHKFIVPSCGTKGGKGTKGPQTTDVAAIYKLVKVTIENKATTNLILILNGPAWFVFNIPAGAIRSYTIPKGEYTYKSYACWRSGSGNLYARHHKSIKIECP